MNQLMKPRTVWLVTLLLTGALLMSGCAERRKDVLSITVDGRAWSEPASASQISDDLEVHITVDGEPVLTLPFSEAHTIDILQPGVGENTVQMTGDAVYMAHADCENQDCVSMGEVTRENHELRVMGGFIVCLPHKLSVEVRGN